MGLFANTKAAKIAFFNSKVTPFTANAVAIGTTSAAVTDMTTKLTAAKAAVDAQVAAMAAAKTATAAADDAVNTLVAAGMDIVKQIRIKASTAGNSVYQLAQIPAPASPTPMGPLGTPTDFKATIQLATGALDLSWKCSNPVGATGILYQVWRRIGAVGEFSYIAGVGGKNFTDDTIPAATSQVQYKIQAARSTSVGAFAQFIVNFGTGGTTEVQAVTETSPRLAA